MRGFQGGSCVLFRNCNVIHEIWWMSQILRLGTYENESNESNKLIDRILKIKEYLHQTFYPGFSRWFWCPF